MKISEIEIGLLELAYEYIDCGMADYVCCALSDAHWKLRGHRDIPDRHRSDAALIRLKDWIQTMLYGDPMAEDGPETLEEWMRDHHYDMYRKTECKHKYARQTRLNWIKWMIRHIKGQV